MFGILLLKFLIISVVADEKSPLWQAKRGLFGAANLEPEAYLRTISPAGSNAPALITPPRALIKAFSTSASA